MRLFAPLLLIHALDTASAAAPTKDISAYFHYEFGRFDEASYDNKETWSGQWFHSVLAGFALEAQPIDRLSLKVNIETRSRNPFPTLNRWDRGEVPNATRFDTYVEQARGRYGFGDPAAPWLDVEAGYFLYKYNPDGRVFGEYLFRGTPYPTLLYTDFNYAKSRLMGVRAGHRKGPFRQDLILSSELFRYPLYDFSLTYLAGFSLGGYLDLGAGASLLRVLPVRTSWTTPKSVDNQAIDVPVQVFTKPNAADSTRVDTVRIDTAYSGPGGKNLRGTSAEGILYGDGLAPNAKYSLGDYYSFGGTLVMGRISLDPKGPDGWALLGKEDLKLYCEVAVLGWKNQPGFYDDRRARTPVMFGFNLPAFRMLDVLGLEMEYLPNPYVASALYADYNGFPHPGHNHTVQDPPIYSRDDWKWGLFAKRTFTEYRMQVVAQVGTDHTRLMDRAGKAYIENMQNPDQWYYQIRVVGSVL